jgi:serine/threonine protein kinase
MVPKYIDYYRLIDGHRKFRAIRIEEHEAGRRQLRHRSQQSAWRRFLQPGLHLVAQEQPRRKIRLQGHLQDRPRQTGTPVLTEISEKKCDNSSKLKLKQYIIKRIKTEVEIGHKINHPNIVRFVYYSETTRNIYIFMELCEL